MGFKRLDEFSQFPSLRVTGLKRTWVYGLVDPRDHTIRYIGVSISPALRLRYHIKHPCNENIRCWFQELKANGEPPPTVVKLAEACDETWERAERSWIAFFRGAGELYNIHEGGRQKGGGGAPRFFGHGHSFKQPNLPNKKRKKKRHRRHHETQAEISQRLILQRDKQQKKRRGKPAWELERQRMLDRIRESRLAGQRRQQ